MPSKLFSVCHLNVRSLCSNFDAFGQSVGASGYDVVALSETWLNESVSSEGIAMSDYNLIRQDRGGRGGGVALYLRRCYSYKIMRASSCVHSESLWVELIVNGKRIVIGVVYRPPRSSYRQFVTDFEDTLSSLMIATDSLICVGDFNVNFLDDADTSTSSLISVTFERGLVSVINEPTRVTPGSETLLDQFFVGRGLCVHSHGTVDASDVSDHRLIYVTLTIVRERSERRVFKCRNLAGIDTNDFYNNLYAVDWFEIFDFRDVNVKVRFLVENVMKVVDILAPLRTVRAIGGHAPWLTHNLREMMKVRDRALSKCKSTGSVSDVAFYRRMRNMTTRAVRAERRAYLAFTCANSDSRALMWREVKNLNVCRSSSREIPGHLDRPDDISSHFETYFSGASPHAMTLSFYRVVRAVSFDAEFNFVFVNERDVLQSISSVKSNAVGLDNMSIKILNLVSSPLMDYLVHIINSCIEVSVFPDAWKQALIVPVPKKSPPSCLGDLRPISILPTLSKVFEKILASQLCRHLDAHGIIPENQSGFRRGYSCTTAIAHIVDDILRATDRGMVTVLIALDYSKAFDSINHELLLAILRFVGLGQSACALMSSFLRGRTQRVRSGESMSGIVNVVSGVPQGSILGPLLYNIYVSEMPKVVLHCKMHFYADDTQIYFSFDPKCIRDAESKINGDLRAIETFCESHCLRLNHAKTAAMVFGPVRSRRVVMEGMKIVMNGGTVGFSSELRNLGFILEPDLRFKKYTSLLIRRAFAGLRLLYMHRDVLSREVRYVLCESLVLSVFNYGDVVYGPCLRQADVYRIQRIQNSCARFVYGLNGRAHVSSRLITEGVLNMRSRRRLHAARFYLGILSLGGPPYLLRKIRFRGDVHGLNVRSRGLLTTPMHNMEVFKRSFTYCVVGGINTLRRLGITVRDINGRYREVLLRSQQ